MRKIILSDHISLDGFVAGVKREIDWIHVDEELFDYIVKLTDQSDTAMYGRVTYELMENYWPSAGSKPNASKHNLIDELWLFVNPIILGEGMPLFKNRPDTVYLKLVESRVFSSGVVQLHYEKI